MIEIDGQRYEAYQIAGTLWMVKWFKARVGTPGGYADGDLLQVTDGEPGSDDENYVECEITTDATDPAEVVRAAIARGSWA